jgi:hypothetical protein
MSFGGNGEGGTADAKDQTPALENSFQTVLSDVERFILCP